jgi:hypothetical protein
MLLNPQSFLTNDSPKRTAKRYALTYLLNHCVKVIMGILVVIGLGGNVFGHTLVNWKRVNIITGTMFKPLVISNNSVQLTNSIFQNSLFKCNISNERADLKQTFLNLFSLKNNLVVEVFICLNNSNTNVLEITFFKFMKDLINCFFNYFELVFPE